MSKPSRARTKGSSRSKRAVKPAAPKDKLQKLVHALEVHEVELEMQNDELRHARGDLEQALSRYTELFDYAPIGYATLADDGSIRELNLHGAALLGKERALLTGMRFALLIEIADVPTFRAIVAEAADGASADIRLVNGVVLNVVATRHPTTVLIAFRDVTERRQEAARLRATEQALREEHRRKDEFLAMLSHELRNPLAPIRTGLFVLARAEPGSDDARNAQDIIARQVAHLTRLVDDLLDVTRITRGKVTLRRERVDFAALVRATVDDHQLGFATRGIALERHFEGPLWVNADAARIVQAVTNVVSNAEKFTPKGGRVTVDLTRQGTWAVLAVRDNGAGIAPELLPRLLEPFAQAPQPSDRGSGGLGLGLATAKGFLELHGGTLTITSEGLGHGVEVEITLPLTVAPGASHHVPGLAGSTRRRVLVIEDHPQAAQSLEMALRLLGHDAKTAHDGPSGIAAVHLFRPDIVLCDIGLPGMDGYEVARALRREDTLGGTYLIALSGYAQPEDLRRATAAGFDRHVAKPADIETLMRVIGEASAPARHPR